MRRITRARLIAFFAVPVAVAAGSVALLGRSDPENAPTCTVAESSRSDYSALVGDNGLYAVPQILHGQGASLYDTAYGALALQAAGQSPRLTATADQVRELLDGDAGTSTVWARWYLAAIERTTGLAVLQEGDADVVAAELSADGHVQETPPGAPQTTEGADIANTFAAVQVIADVRGPEALQALTATRRWVAQEAASYSGHPYLYWLLAEAGREFGDEPPAALLSRAEQWLEAEVGRADEVDFSSTAHDLYGYAALMRSVGRTVPATVYAYFDPLRANLVSQRDLQLVYYVADAWRGAPDPSAGPAAGVAESVRGQQLPNGLVASPGQVLGGVDASYFVQSIRGIRGEDTCDPQLAQALGLVDDSEWRALDAPGQGMWVASMKAASGDVDPARRRQALTALLADLPPLVTPDNVRRWSLEAELVQLLGGEVPWPGQDGWPAADRIGVAGAAMLVTTLAQLHAPLDGLDAITVEDLVTALSSPALTPTTDEYFRALTAYADLGGVVSPEMVDQARERGSAVMGCADVPTLARDTAQGADCDLRSSLSLARAERQLPALVSNR